MRDRRMAIGAWECYSSLSRCHFRRPLETQIMTAAGGSQRGDKGGNAGASQVGQDQFGHKVYRPVIGRPHFSHESHTTHLMQFICSMAHSVWLVVYIFIMPQIFAYPWHSQFWPARHLIVKYFHYIFRQTNFFARQLLPSCQTLYLIKKFKSYRENIWWFRMLIKKL